MKDITSIKYQLVSNVYLYIRTKEDRYKIEALSNLKSLADCYHVKIKKVRPIDLNIALTQFLTNKSGIATYLNLLNSSLK